MSMRVFELRGMPDNVEEADALCREAVSVQYAHMRDKDGRFFLAIQWGINYINKLGIEEVTDPAYIAYVAETVSKA